MSQRFPARRLLLLSLSLGLALLPSCRSTNQFLKAKPAKLSAFLEHKNEMKDPRKELPFHKFWKSSDPKVWDQVQTKTSIYIAPVSLEYLRPVKKSLAGGEVAMGTIKRNQEKMASLMHDAFEKAFQDSAKARFQVAKEPGPNTVTLNLALVELNPTSTAGNTVINVASFVVGPLVYLGAYFTKGNIAMEGKLQISATGDSVVEFADNEEDPLTILSVRDFVPYGHAKKSIRNWASEFEQFTRKAPGKRIRGSAFFTLNPF